MKRSTDIGGAYTVGMQGILVRTVKIPEEEAVDNAPVKPAFIINSIAELRDIL